jgi:hypothetical protein
MPRLFTSIAFAVLLLLVSAFVSTKPLVLEIERQPKQQARTALVVPFLQNLRDFGNKIAALMLSAFLRLTYIGNYERFQTGKHTLTFDDDYKENIP